jgi:hypothetical protein
MWTLDVVLADQPNPAGAEPNTEERFYFAKGAGWYRRVGRCLVQPARDFQP